jgi:hypothetical protein
MRCSSQILEARSAQSAAADGSRDSFRENGEFLPSTVYRPKALNLKSRDRPWRNDRYSKALDSLFRSDDMAANQQSPQS